MRTLLTKIEYNKNCKKIYIATYPYLVNSGVFPNAVGFAQYLATTVLSSSVVVKEVCMLGLRDAVGTLLMLGRLEGTLLG
jgi:hypothetical protein